MKEDFFFQKKSYLFPLEHGKLHVHEKANRSAPFGLDLLDFHGRIDLVD
ncbi:hypothetical protein [Selenomonas sputigena]|nr:hypothetical protein [Selenomonas sputigena]UZE45345.1 hypothetical protein OL236_12355 [Selenomonas sputigena]